MSLTIGRTLALPEDANVSDLLEFILADHTDQYTLEDYLDGEGNLQPNGKVIKFTRPFTRERVTEIGVLLHEEQPNTRVNVRVKKEATTGLHHRIFVTYKDFYANDAYHLKMVTKQVLDQLLNVTINPLTLLDWTPRKYKQHEVDVWIKEKHPLNELAQTLKNHLKDHLPQTYSRSDVIIANWNKDEAVMLVDIIGQSLENNDDKTRTVYLFFQNGYKGEYTLEARQAIFDKLKEWSHVKNAKFRFGVNDIKIFDNLPLFAKQFPVSESKKRELQKQQRPQRGRPMQRKPQGRRPE